jgi:hypothetical protein
LVDPPEVVEDQSLEVLVTLLVPKAIVEIEEKHVKELQ